MHAFRGASMSMVSICQGPDDGEMAALLRWVGLRDLTSVYRSATAAELERALRLKALVLVAVLLRWRSLRCAARQRWSRHTHRRATAPKLLAGVRAALCWA
jgi:hypothetical protein